MPPEVAQLRLRRAASATITTQTDMWSFGVLVFELLTNTYPFYAVRIKEGQSDMEDEVGMLEQIVSGEITWPQILFSPTDDLSSLLSEPLAISSLARQRSLIEGLLQRDPSKRLTAAQALDHEFFTQKPRQNPKLSGVELGLN